MARGQTQTTTTPAKVEQYETTASLLDALYVEIQTLSKKKPEATLNASKVKLINRLLTDIKNVLSDEAGIKYLDVLDDEELPQYSDVVLVLSQFSASMKAFKQAYFRWDPGEQNHRWFTR